MAKKKAAKKKATKKPRSTTSATRKGKKSAARSTATKTTARKTASRGTSTRKAAAKKKTAKQTTSRSPRKAVNATPEAAAEKAPPRRRTKLPARQLERIRDFLREKRAAIRSHLQTELLELEKPEDKHHRADLEEVASDTHEKDSLCEIMDIEASQIGQIELALQKIEDGTYGVCEDCDGAIAPARLEALPFASQCIECKRKSELQGDYSTAHGRLA